MNPDSEAQLREQFRSIEALVAGAARSDARPAAGAACERLRARLKTLEQQSPAIEIQFSIPDAWSRQLFAALCRRYGLQPFRYARQKRTTMMTRAPRPFVDEVLWPEFQALDKALAAFLKEGASRAIHAEVHPDSSEPITLAPPPPGSAGP